MPAIDQLVLIAAVASNGVIGAGNGMPWHLPEDLRHFKETTFGHPIIVGRRTFDAVGVLPGRDTIVISRDPSFAAAGAQTAHSFDDAVRLAATAGDDGPVFVAGGAQVYRLALAAGARKQILSEVHGSPDGDTFYPRFDREEWSERSREPRDGFDIVRWER